MEIGSKSENVKDAPKPHLKGTKPSRVKAPRGRRRPSFVWPPPSELPRCNVCFKPEGVCFCPDIQAHKSAVEIVILQHPSEARNPESTARLASLAWKDSLHVVGLSWPSLSKLLEREVNPSEWAVLYLGTKKDTEKLKVEGSVLVSRGGDPKDIGRLKGLIFIDGNWRQSKTLWWRNPWLNRMNRLILQPKVASAYSEARRQPRKECLSTIEAVGNALSFLKKEESSANRMTSILQRHLKLLREFKQQLKHPVTPMTTVATPLDTEEPGC